MIRAKDKKTVLMHCDKLKPGRLRQSQHLLQQRHEASTRATDRRHHHQPHPQHHQNPVGARRPNALKAARTAKALATTPPATWAASSRTGQISTPNRRAVMIDAKLMADRAERLAANGCEDSAVKLQRILRHAERVTKRHPRWCQTRSGRLRCTGSGRPTPTCRSASWPPTRNTASPTRCRGTSTRQSWTRCSRTRNMALVSSVSRLELFFLYGLRDRNRGGWSEAATPP